MNYLNLSYLNLDNNQQNYPNADYVWVDGFGGATSLSNPREFVVLRDGIHGFCGVSDERSVVQSSNEYAEW